MPRALMPHQHDVWIWAWPEQGGFAEITVEVNGRRVASAVWRADELLNPEGFARLESWWRAEVGRHC